LFVYCTRVLRMSESAAYARIEAARTARRFPVILEMSANASITLTTVLLLAPVLNAANHGEVLATATHKSKREVQEIVARLRPASVVQPTIRKLAAVTLPASAAAQAFLAPHRDWSEDAGASEQPMSRPVPTPPPPRVTPLAPERYRIQFTVNAETHAKL